MFFIVDMTKNKNTNRFVNVFFLTESILLTLVNHI